MANEGKYQNYQDLIHGMWVWYLCWSAWVFLERNMIRILCKTQATLIEEMQVYASLSHRLPIQPPTPVGELLVKVCQHQMVEYILIEIPNQEMKAQLLFQTHSAPWIMSGGIGLPAPKELLKNFSVEDVDDVVKSSEFAQPFLLLHGLEGNDTLHSVILYTEKWQQCQDRWPESRIARRDQNYLCRGSWCQLLDTDCTLRCYPTQRQSNGLFSEILALIQLES